MEAARSCLGCGEKNLQHIRTYRTKSARGRELFGGSVLSRCRACDLIQVDPLPGADALNAYYTHDYRTGGLYGSDTNDATTFPRDNLFYFNRAESIGILDQLQAGDVYWRAILTAPTARRACGTSPT